jgi:uncharacterized Zn finger protein (UPF0148 family)
MNPTCSKCGAPPWRGDSRYCINCGHRLIREDDSRRRPTRAVTSGWTDRP